MRRTVKRQGRLKTVARTHISCLLYNNQRVLERVAQARSVSTYIRYQESR